MRSGFTITGSIRISSTDAFLSELIDFKEKSERVATLYLEPDFNDGVVLNIAPLWELVPWSEEKKYWDELMKGSYEWSSIGEQLMEKKYVKTINVINLILKQIH
jgi:hypothetical protein